MKPLCRIGRSYGKINPSNLQCYVKMNQECSAEMSQETTVLLTVGRGCVPGYRIDKQSQDETSGSVFWMTIGKHSAEDRMPRPLCFLAAIAV